MRRYFTENKFLTLGMPRTSDSWLGFFSPRIMIDGIFGGEPFLAPSIPVPIKPRVVKINMNRGACVRSRGLNFKFHFRTADYCDDRFILC